MKHYITILFCVILPILAMSRPYRGDTIQLKQPDNTYVPVVIFGNEFHHEVESIDGYTLIRNNDDWICYADISSDGEQYISTNSIYEGKNAPDIIKETLQKNLRISDEAVERIIEKNKRKIGYNHVVNQEKKRVSLPDTVIGLTILIDFPDVKSDITVEQVEAFCNGDNYKEYRNFSSIKEYFQWVSGGKLTYINHVYGYVTADENKDYYDNTEEYAGPKLFSIIDKALNQMKNEGYDFSKLTLESGKYFLAVNLFYAGTPDAGWANGLWPHSGWFGGRFSWNGLEVGSYQITDLGSELTIGTFIHENGHLVCNWPDFYAYDDHQDNNEIYCFGCGNDKNPGMPSPWQRDDLGWLDAVDITNVEPGTEISLKAYSHDAAIYYGDNTGGKDERYYIEVRRSNSDHREPDEGILIWHNNLNGDNTYEGNPEFQELRPATQAAPCFRKGNKTEFNDLTSPSGVWYSGSNSGIDILNISEVSDTMTFLCGSPTPKIITDDMPYAYYGAEYNADITVIGGDKNYSFTLLEGEVPEGLTLHENGTISGIPEKAGAFSLTVLVKDGKGVYNVGNINLKVGYNGIRYKYYERRSMTEMPDFATREPIEEGVKENFTAIGLRDDNYAYLYEGYIYIAESDDYTFSIHSDDGSILYINGEEVANNDGQHPMSNEGLGTVHLENGYHSIRLEYFENTYGEGLIVGYESSTMELQSIPNSILYVDKPKPHFGEAILPNTYTSVEYEHTIEAYGGIAPYTIELTDGILPNGITLNNGTIAGTTNDFGTFAFTLSLTDAEGTTVNQNFSLQVKQNGVYYSYYEINSLSSMPSFSRYTPRKEGIFDNFVFNSIQRNDYWAFEYKSYIEIEEEGTYSFYTTSDDGSILYIEDDIVVDNGELHGMEEKSGDVFLEAGRHEIVVQFFESTGNEGLIVEYELPGKIEKQPILNEILFLSPEQSENNTYTIEANTTTGGSISPKGTAYTSEGTNVTYIFIPEAEYSLNTIIVDGEPLGSMYSYTFNSISENHTIEAVYGKPNAVQHMELNKGWNFIAFNVIPTEMEFTKLFPNMTELKSDNNFYNTEFPAMFNNLKQVEAGKGYFIKNTIDEIVEIEGIAVEPKEYDLTKGWNYIGSQWTESRPIEEVLGDNISAIKNFDEFWKPDGSGNLETIDPGLGYFVYFKE